MSKLEERITQLETRLEFQDHTIATLNDELVAHQRTIATLTKQMELIARRLPEKDTLEHNPESEPPPPHY